MSRAARLPVVEAGPDPADPPRDGHPTAAALDRVVQLFARAGGGLPDGTPGLSEREVTASIDLVRRVAVHVRTVQEQAHTVAVEARQKVLGAAETARAALARANEAETRARAAAAEVERAGQQIAELGVKLAAAERRAALAEARAEEAQTWLQRLHDCMANEFAALTIEPI